MRHELTADRHIPYTAHVAPEVVKTAFGDYLQVFRLAGASFESATADRSVRPPGSLPPATTPWS